MKLLHHILQKPILLYACIVLFIGYFGLLSALRHEHLLSLRLDLGNMDQTVWNVAQGNGFVLTDPESDRQVSRLAYHADFFLILLAPLYWIWSSPYMLLFVQALVVGLGALPIYWIADKALKSKSLALLFAVSYLLYPPLERGLLYDFHGVTVATTFLLFAYWYMTQSQWFRFVIFAVLAALCKEQIWITTALMGMYIVIVKKRWVFGSIITLISTGMFYVLFWKVIPHYATANQHFALKYLSDFGGDMSSVLSNALIHPVQVLTTIIAPDRVWYLFQLFSPVGFISFLSPWKLLFAAPDFAISLLSNNGLMRSIDYQYNSTITPFLYISAIEGFVVMAKMRIAKEKKKYVAASVLFGTCIVLASYVWGVLPKGLHSLSWYYFREPAGYETMKHVLENIDPKYSVSITNNLGSQVSQRKELYNFPIAAHRADYVIVKLDDKAAWPSLYEQQQVTEEVRVDSNYELFAHTGSFSAFRKKGL